MAGVADSYSTSPALDLSRLPAPAVVKPLSYDAIRADLIADLRVRAPEFDAVLPSDPVVKLLEIAAYRIMILMADVNDAARSVMLAFAAGSDLDQLAALYGVERLILRPKTDRLPIAMENDADLRRRVQLAPEALAAMGMTGGGYQALALRVAPAVKDAAIIKRAGGRVDIVLLGRDGDGAVPADIVQAVYRATQGDGATALTDVVTVRSAAIVAYAPSITLRIRRGPDPAAIRAAAEAAVRAYAADRHRVGAIVYAQMIESAASVGGVERALVDIDDVEPGVAGAPWMQALAITIEIAP